MKPLYNITHQSKECKFNSFIYDILTEIDQLANKWFLEVFIEPKDYICESILSRNLIDDLDYLFSECIWLIELGEKQNFKIDSKEFVESQYNSYVTIGYKGLVSDSRYNRLENRVNTEKEIKDNSDRMNAVMKRILNEIDFD